MDKGELPAREMFEGVCLVLAGCLLTVPGFVTDTLGLLLFIPPVRHLLRLLIAHHLAAKVASGEARIFVGGVRAGPRGPHARQPGRDGEVIEGDYEDVTDAEERRDSQRSEEHTSELQSLMRISYAVFCLQKKKHTTQEKRRCEKHL